MAAVDFRGKAHGGTETSAILRHQDPSRENRTRVLEAKRKIGQPCHINPENSDLNYVLCMNEDGKIEEVEFDKGVSYYDATFAYYKEKLAEIDAEDTQRNKRKDRVTMLSLEIPFPPELSGTDPDTREKGKRWITRVIEIIRDHYTVEGEPPILLPGVVHVDELHSYIDVATEQSRDSVCHLHLPTIPFIPGRGLCCKQFSSRANMIAINHAIDEMTQKEFGVPFLTGSKKKSRETVDDLKAKSEALEAEINMGKRKLKKKTEEIKDVIEEVEQVQKQIPIAIEQIVQIIQSQRKEAERAEVEKMEAELMEFLEQEGLVKDWSRFKWKKRQEKQSGFGDFVYSLSKDQKAQEETKDALMSELDVLIDQIEAVKSKADKALTL